MFFASEQQELHGSTEARNRRIVHTRKDFPPSYRFSCTVPFINRPPSTNRKMAGSSCGSIQAACLRAAFSPRSGRLALAVSAPVAQPYEATLAPAALHDAYVLGQRNDQTTAEFLDPYAKQTTGAVDGGTPHLSEIEVLTPFAQVVDESRRKGSGGFSEQQALAAYHRRGDTLVIRVNLVLPAAYPEKERGAQAPSVSHDQKQTDALRPEELSGRNSSSLSNRTGKTIPTKSIHNQPVYSGSDQKFSFNSRRPDSLARIRPQERR